MKAEIQAILNPTVRALFKKVSGTDWNKLNENFTTPGKTYLRHCNEAPDRFNILIEIRHRWFGTMFCQAGVFHEKLDRSVDPQTEHLKTVEAAS